MNPLFYQRENIRLIIGAGDGMRELNTEYINNTKQIITELEGDNLLEKYNSFICKPISMEYYPINMEYLSQFRDENEESRAYQLQICDMNDNEQLMIFEEEFKNKVEIIDFQKNTWYFINNPRMIKTCIEVLKIGGKFKFPFYLNNSRYHSHFGTFKKSVEASIKNVSSINVAYSDRAQKYLLFKGGNLYFPNALYIFNERTYGRKDDYFTVIKNALYHENIIFKINEFKKYFEHIKDKIEYTEQFEQFYLNVITQYNHIFSQNSSKLRCTEDDIYNILCDVMGLNMFYIYFAVNNFSHKILIDIDEEKNIIIQRVE